MTSADYRPDLPANLHDYRYWCGGEAGAQFLADCEHYWGLRRECDAQLTGWWRPLRLLARVRVRSRFRVLREVGHYAWDGHRQAGHTG